ncbi:MAG TPA: hypothetical protein PKE16_12605 [Hyphomicrobium sp.]|nr:hypothetical protein [Hyphomicrobium sp.]
MTSNPSPEPKPKHDLTPRRAFLLAAYIFALVVLARLYWPGWPFPDRPHPAPQAPVTGTQVPQQN